MHDFLKVQLLQGTIGKRRESHMVETSKSSAQASKLKNKCIEEGSDNAPFMG
jgi:hypothetical protein